jgi:hypothetical protein
MAAPDVGPLPVVADLGDEDLAWQFLWMAAACARASGKGLLKPRRRLNKEETARLRRTLEHVAHGARMALAYLAQWEKEALSKP